MCERGRLTVDILTERHEAWILPGQLGQSEMGSVWLSLESHVTTIAVELPDQSRVGIESLGCR